MIMIFVTFNKYRGLYFWSLLLATVLGVSLIERVILAALAGGATDFVVVTGYEAEPLESFLVELAARLGVAITPVRVPRNRAPGASAWSRARSGPSPTTTLVPGRSRLRKAATFFSTASRPT